jgi:GTPase
MTKEHIAIACALGLPVAVAVTKVPQSLGRVLSSAFSLRST